MYVKDSEKTSIIHPPLSVVAFLGSWVFIICMKCPVAEVSVVTFVHSSPGTGHSDLACILIYGTCLT